MSQGRHVSKTLTGFDEVLDATFTLCGHSFVVAHCTAAKDDATSLGVNDARSLLYLATPTVDANQRVFVLNISTISCVESTKAVLVAFLSRPNMIKLVWDGRETARRLKQVLGVKLAPVFDLQIVELFARGMTVQTHIVGKKERQKVKVKRPKASSFANPFIKQAMERMGEGTHEIIDLGTCLKRYLPDFPVQNDRSARAPAFIFKRFMKLGFLPIISRTHDTQILSYLRPLLERSRRHVSTVYPHNMMLTFDRDLFPVNLPPSDDHEVASKQHDMIIQPAPVMSVYSRLSGWRTENKEAQYTSVQIFEQVYSHIFQGKEENE